jgi:hypothetical protein
VLAESRYTFTLSCDAAIKEQSQLEIIVPQEYFDVNLNGLLECQSKEADTLSSRVCTM